MFLCSSERPLLIHSVLTSRTRWHAKASPSRHLPIMWAARSSTVRRTRLASYARGLKLLLARTVIVFSSPPIPPGPFSTSAVVALDTTCPGKRCFFGGERIFSESGPGGAQRVVRVVVVVPVLVAVVPAPALEPYAKREAVSCGAVCTQGLDGFGFRTLFSSRRREGYRPVVESSLPACTKSNHRLL